MISRLVIPPDRGQRLQYRDHPVELEDMKRKLLLIDPGRSRNRNEQEVLNLLESIFYILHLSVEGAIYRILECHRCSKLKPCSQPFNKIFENSRRENHRRELLLHTYLPCTTRCERSADLQTVLIFEKALDILKPLQSDLGLTSCEIFKGSSVVTAPLVLLKAAADYLRDGDSAALRNLGSGSDRH